MVYLSLSVSQSIRYDSVQGGRRCTVKCFGSDTKQPFTDKHSKLNAAQRMLNTPRVRMTPHDEIHPELDGDTQRVSSVQHSREEVRTARERRQCA